MTIRTLLVDDEPLALERLRDLLRADPEVEVVGACLDGARALEAIRLLQPDLLFLDIQMPELDGFEVLEALAPGERPLTVFATAYDRFALQAFQARALDYLLKPFGMERLRETLSRVKAVLRGARAVEHQGELEALLASVERRPRPERFVIQVDRRVVVLSADEVDAVEAEGNYAWVYRGKDAYPVRGTMASLEARLGPLGFVRVHRSWLLNLDRLRELQLGAKGGIAVTAGELRVPVSGPLRRKLQEALEAGR